MSGYRANQFLILCIIVAFTFPMPGAVAGDLSAGTAKVDITPPLGFPMWGYGSRHDAPSVGVLDPLYARAVVLKVSKEQVAIVSLDLGRAPTRDSYERIMKQLKKTGIEHVFLVASHTHHGPVIELDDWPSVKKSYVRALEKKLVSVIKEAGKRLQPALLGVASSMTTFNRNRHSRLPNTPVDREFLVARIESAANKPIAHLVNFAAHPTMHPSKVRKISADYPGTMAKYLEEKTQAPCLFLQGAAGDLSPNPGTAKGPVEFGTVLGKHVTAIDDKIQCAIGKSTSLKWRHRDFRFKSRIDLSNPIIKSAYSMAFFPDLVSFYERDYREGIRPRLVTAVLDGKIGLVGVSGEFFSEHAISLKKRARLDHLLFLGYCNDYHQYFPTIQAAAEGGYGADITVSPVETGAGEAMMNQALIDLYQLRGKIGEPKLLRSH